MPDKFDLEITAAAFEALLDAWQKFCKALAEELEPIIEKLAEILEEYDA